MGRRVLSFLVAVAITLAVTGFWSATPLLIGWWVATGIPSYMLGPKALLAQIVTVTVVLIVTIALGLGQWWLTAGIIFVMAGPGIMIGAIAQAIDWVLTW